MSSDRSGSPRLRSPRRGTQKTGAFQYVILAVVAILVIIIVVVVASGGKKDKGATARTKSKQTKVVRTESEATEARGSRVKVSGRKERKSRRQLAREERLARRRERMTRSRKEGRSGRVVTSRSGRGGYSSKRSSVPVLKAILPEPSGERVALIGERRVKKGDQIEGRRIIDVEQDRVKVEYFTKTYEVKLNQPLY